MTSREAGYKNKLAWNWIRWGILHPQPLIGAGPSLRHPHSFMCARLTRLDWSGQFWYNHVYLPSCTNFSALYSHTLRAFKRYTFSDNLIRQGCKIPSKNRPATARGSTRNAKIVTFVSVIGHVLSVWVCLIQNGPRCQSSRLWFFEDRFMSFRFWCEAAMERQGGPIMI